MSCTPVYLEVILELGEEAAVDADHHVHGARGHHRPQPRHLAQHPEGHLRVVLHHPDGRVEEGLRGVLQDSGKGALKIRTIKMRLVQKFGLDSALRGLS